MVVDVVFQNFNYLRAASYPGSSPKTVIILFFDGYIYVTVCCVVLYMHECIHASMVQPITIALLQSVLVILYSYVAKCVCYIE